MILALVLTAFGLYAAYGRGAGAGVARPGAAAAGPAPDVVARRRALLLEVARLDEAFEAQGNPSEAERAQYRRRRAELLSQVRALSGE